MATPPAKKPCNKGRSTAAKDRKLRAAGAEIVSALATINIRVLTDEKLADIVQWMGRMNISAVALQEVAAKANNFLSLGARYTLHMGPCGQGPKGGAMRGCAWVVDNQWARQVGFEMGVSTVHSSSISIATSKGRIELVSVYSAPGVAKSAEEVELSSRSKRAPVVWLGDINDDPAKPSAKSYWGGLMSSAWHLALSREGCWSKVPTRHPPINIPNQTASHLDVISMKQQLATQLAAECVHVGPELDEVFQPHTDHRPVVVNITTNIKWTPKPKAKRVAWDLRKVESDPKLKAQIAAELKAPFLKFTQEWASFSSGATQSQVDSAGASLRDALVQAATKVIGTRQCRKAAKPWWSNDLTKANNLKRRLHKAGSKATASLRERSDMLSAQRAYKALIRTEKRKLISTQIDKAGQRGCQQRTQAIFNWYKHAEGKASAGSKEFLGQRATLKYRHFKETCVNSAQVAECVSKFTEEVSLGRDLAGNMDAAYKAEVHEAQATIMRDPSSGRGKSPITTSNIKAALKKLNQKLRKAPGKDGLTNWMMAWAGTGIVEPLRLLFTAMWTSNTTPEHMTDVLVKYIPKHSRPSLEISEYRPISLISCLGKLYTMVWLPSLTDKLQPHITKHQGAFQKGTGALEQAWLATQLLQERREQGIETHAALTDLEKCYDTVWREGLYFLLYSYGVQNDMLRNTKSWIENTRAIPEWNGTVGKGVTPREGLKQGCRLSPILCTPPHAL